MSHRRGGRSGSGGGGGVGAGGLPRDQWGTDSDPLYRDAISQGVPESTARALVSNPSERTRLARSMASGAITTARGEGNRLDSDTRALGRDIDAGRAVQTAAEHAQQLINSASDAELRAAFLGGELGSLTPARIQELRSAINEMQARVLMERSGASVAEEEFDRTRREMGTIPTQSTQVLRGWVGRQVENARQLRQRIRARYADDVVQSYDSRLQREGITPERSPGAQRSGDSAPAQTPATNNMVPMIRPDGARRRVPADRVEDAEAAGWRRAD